MKNITRIALIILLQLEGFLPDNLSDVLVFVPSEFVFEANDT